MPNLTSNGLLALAYAGIGSGAGVVIAAFISTRSQKVQARADAADMLTEAAERVSRMNTRLTRENHALRRILDTLCDAVADFVAGRIGVEELDDAVLKAKTTDA